MVDWDRWEGNLSEVWSRKGWVLPFVMDTILAIRLDVATGNRELRERSPSRGLKLMTSGWSSVHTTVF